jgi:hypothetical protein
MEPTIKKGTTVTARVPAGEIYVMEDNRGSGIDSAQKGTLPVDAVVDMVDLG